MDFQQAHSYLRQQPQQQLQQEQQRHDPCDLSSLYELRMSEFCGNYLNYPSVDTANIYTSAHPTHTTHIDTHSAVIVNPGVTRPKCSISPINDGLTATQSPSGAGNNASNISYAADVSSTFPHAYLTSMYASESSSAVSSPVVRQSHPFLVKNASVYAPMGPPTVNVSMSTSHCDSGYYAQSNDSSSITNNSAMLGVPGLQSSPFTGTGSLAGDQRVLKNKRLQLAGAFAQPTSLQFQSTPNKSATSNHSQHSVSSFLSSSSTTYATTATTSQVREHGRPKPATSRINFHSITDLAKSADSLAQPKQQHPLATHGNDQLKSGICQPSECLPSSLPSLSSTSIIPPMASSSSTRLSFNEQLSLMSASLRSQSQSNAQNDKENSHEFINKVCFIVFN